MSRESEIEEIRHPHTPSWRLKELAYSEYAYTRMILGENPRVDEETLFILAKDPDEDVRYNVAQLENLTPDVLDYLSKDYMESVRFYVAQNKNIRGNTLSKMFHTSDEASRVLGAIAGNPNVSHEILISCMSSLNKELREGSASNPKTNPSFLRMLSNDKEWTVRYNVVRNPNVSLEVLKYLVEDEVNGVKGGVCGSPKVTPDLLERLYYNSFAEPVLRGVAKHPLTPVFILEALSDEKHPWETVGALAHNPALPREILDKIVASPTSRVRSEIAQSPYLPLDLQLVLARDTDLLTRSNIAHREDVLPDLLEELSTDPEESVRNRVMDNLKTLPLTRARLMVQEGFYLRDKKSLSTDFLLKQALKDLSR